MRRHFGFRVLIALNLGIALAYVGFWIITLNQRLTWRADFTAFYTAAVMVRDGVKGDRLYDFALQTQYQQRILNGRYLADGVMAFYYPPYVALLLAPLAFLSRRSAYIVWSMAQVLLLGVLLRRLWVFTRSKGWTSRTRIAMLSIIAALPPMMISFLLGTFSLIVLICLIELSVASHKEYKAAAGLWLALGLLKPQTMLFPGIMLVASGQWLSVCVGLIAFGFAVLVSAIFFGPGVWDGFLRAVTKAFAATDSLGVTPSAMYNFKGVVASLFSEISPGLLGIVGIIVFVLACLYSFVIWMCESDKNRNFELNMAITLLCGLVFGPHVNPQDGILAVVPGLWLYQSIRNHPSIKKYSWALVGLPGLMLVVDYGIPGGLPVAVIIMLVLLIWAVYLWLGRQIADADKAP